MRTTLRTYDELLQQLKKLAQYENTPLMRLTGRTMCPGMPAGAG